MTWISNWILFYYFYLIPIHVCWIFVNKNKDFFRNSDIHKRIDTCLSYANLTASGVLVKSTADVKSVYLSQQNYLSVFWFGSKTCRSLGLSGSLKVIPQK